MNLRIVLALSCLMLAAGCADLQQALPAPTNGRTATFGGPEMLDYMTQTAPLEGAGLAAEMRRLQASRAPVDRFKLAYLLGREGASNEDLARAQDLLSGLESAFTQPEARLLVRQQQRTVALELALRQERRRSAELQDKIEKLKNLEQQLLERSQTKHPGAGR